MSAAIASFGAVSGLGKSWEAVSAGNPGERPRIALRRDPVLQSADFGRPFCARVADLPEGAARAEVLLKRAIDECIYEVDSAIPKWRKLRVGFAIGTSSGGMGAAEIWFSSQTPIEDASKLTYNGPIWPASSNLPPELSPVAVVLGACASATFALGLALRWLDASRCDIVFAGGFDAVALFVAAGFEVLHATTAELPPRPFRVGRDGMALGEGAAILALVPPDAISKPHGYIRGFGATSDAVHLTAPDRTGSGVAEAAIRALRDAQMAPAEMDLVSAHATATPFNDAAEKAALHRVFADDLSRVVVHPFKAQIGHTLGAAGALESLACVDAIRRGIFPAAAGDGTLDPEASVRLLDRAEAHGVSNALKLSAAFGGANAALVVSSHPSSEARKRARHSVEVSRAVHVTAPLSFEELAREIGWTVDRIARTDMLTQLSLSALVRLRAEGVSFADAGLIVGESFATVETNARFRARMDERGARNAEPRKFPYTSPNAAPGECSVAFQLKGPGFTVGGGLHAGLEAMCVAHSFVESGDAERMVVVAVDECGPVVEAFLRSPPYEGWTVREGAIALVLSRHRGNDNPEANPDKKSRANVQIVRAEVGFRRGATFKPAPGGHLALKPLVESSFVPLIEAYSPPGNWARIDFGPAAFNVGQ